MQRVRSIVRDRGGVTVVGGTSKGAAFGSSMRYEARAKEKGRGNTCWNGTERN